MGDSKWQHLYVLPGHIACFIDLSNIPDNLQYNPGIYALVESASHNRDRQENSLSRLFEPFSKDVTIIGNDIRRKYYLVDVNSFESPACLIPDIGNIDDTALLRLKPKQKWVDMFVDWLNRPAKRQVRSTK